MCRVQCVFLLFALPAVFAQYYYPESFGASGIGDCNSTYNPYYILFINLTVLMLQFLANINGFPVSSGSGGCNSTYNLNYQLFFT